MNKEELILAIMAEAEKDGEPVTREEAEEMAEMELKAKGIKSYTQAEEKKPRKKREVKKDPTKVAFINYLAEWLKNTDVTDVQIVNEQKEVAFRINDEDYSLSLIKHRTKKGE